MKPINTYKPIKLLITFLIFFGLNNIPSYAETMEAAVFKVVEKSPHIEALRYTTESSYQNYLFNKETGYSTLDIYGGIGVEKNYDYLNTEDEILDKFNAGINFKCKLFDGYEQKFIVEQSKFKYHADYYQQILQEQNIVLDSIEKYLDVLRYHRLLEASEKHFEKMGLYTEQAKERLDNGVSNEIELDVSSRYLLKAEEVYLSAKNNFEDSIAEYKVLLGGVPDINTMTLGSAVDPKQIPQNLDKAIAIALSNHPVIRICNENIKQAESEYRGSFSNNYPDVNLLMDAKWSRNMGNNTERDRDISVMFQVKHNLLGPETNYYHNKSLDSKVRKIKATCKQKEREVEQSIRLSYQALQATKKAANAAKLFEKTSVDILQKTNKRFVLGNISLEKILQLEVQHLESESTKTNFQYDGLFSLYRVLHATGLILNHFNLGI